MVGIKHASTISATGDELTATVWVEGHTVEGVVRAYLGTQQTITTSSATKVELDTETYDPDSVFSTANYRYSPATAGYYLVVGQAEYIDLGDGDLAHVAIYVTGAEYSRGHLQTGMASDQLNCQIMDLVYLGSGDYIELYTYHEKGSNANIDSGATKTFMAVAPLRV